MVLEQMALPGHGHIIEEPEEDYRGKEIKTGLEEKDSIGEGDEATARKIMDEKGGGGQNMFGKCSSTCLQFIINFLEPSQSYGCGAHANRAITSHWQM